MNELMQCTGCDFIIREGKSVRDYFPNALKCCPDSNYVKLNVCTPTERAFLDEIREKGYMVADRYLMFDSYNAYEGSGTQLDQKDFTKCSLQELMEKKG